LPKAAWFGAKWSTSPTARRFGCDRSSIFLVFTVFTSVHDIEAMTKHRPKSLHFMPKGQVEAYLRASGLAHAILRSVAFFSNLNNATNCTN
jgi:hypothetical protein